jgi:hypothetical protein
MEILLVIIATPMAVWFLDWLLYRGELTQAVCETVAGARAGDRKKGARK